MISIGHYKLQPISTSVKEVYIRDMYVHKSNIISMGFHEAKCQFVGDHTCLMLTQLKYKSFREQIYLSDSKSFHAGIIGPDRVKVTFQLPRDLKSK